MQSIKDVLVDIATKNGGLLRPRDVVDEARNPTNPLHTYFEWDDTSAADEYRVLQAAYLIRRIKIKITRESEDPKAVSVTVTRAFSSLPSSRGKDGGYELTERILQVPEKRQELLQEAINALNQYRAKYAALRELVEVIEAIDNTLEQLKEAS